MLKDSVKTLVNQMEGPELVIDLTKLCKVNNADPGCYSDKNFFKAESAVSAVGENCLAFQANSLLASLTFDSETKRLLLRTQNLRDEYSGSISVSELMTLSPRFYDR